MARGTSTSDDTQFNIQKRKYSISAVCIILLMLSLYSIQHISIFSQSMHKLKNVKIVNFWNDSNDNTSAIIRLNFSSSRSDGTGCQIQQIIADIVYAFKHSKYYEFYYEDLNGHPHDVNMKQTNEFLNFGKHIKNIKYCTDCIYVDFRNKVNLAPSFYYDNQTLTFLRNMYFQNKTSMSMVFDIINNKTITSQIQYNVSHFNIAVHIRGGDLFSKKFEKLGQSRLLPYLYYISLMHHIQKSIINSTRSILTFRIFSQYNFNITLFEDTISRYYPKFYARFVNREINLLYKIGLDLRLTMHLMVISDALICSRSVFSYTNAILSKSKYIYYVPLWHNPLPHWNIVFLNNMEMSNRFTSFWKRCECIQQSNNIQIDIVNITICKQHQCRNLPKHIRSISKFKLHWIPQ